MLTLHRCMDMMGHGLLATAKLVITEVLSFSNYTAIFKTIDSLDRPQESQFQDENRNISHRSIAMRN